MTDEQRETLKLALGATLQNAGVLLALWHNSCSPDLAAEVVQSQAFGGRVGLLIRGPEDASVAIVQVVLTSAGNVARVFATFEYDLATRELTVRDGENRATLAS